MKNLILLGMMLLITGMMSGCAKEDKAATWFYVDENGYTSFTTSVLGDELNAIPDQPLSGDEAASLLFMREEEKLAHDLYAKLYTIWPVQAFSHIAASELTHTEAVLLLIQKYNLDDPSEGNGPGEFTDPTLETLYNDLLNQGMASEIDALKVGALVEEVDIQDLQTALVKIDNQDIIWVYENLMKGSRNHLRAFVKNLKMRGINYTPQVLSQDAFDVIINGEMETGSNNKP
ncbi:MAG: DUF2202 domain-containing protein [Saprospiraceae bacterium]|nr:DUF2202 domain-containing protein [Lewinellaceae bacterium]HRW74348.1 DUF2202 domain-containing protein [Saprospiraceae bacterium]